MEQSPVPECAVQQSRDGHEGPDADDLRRADEAMRGIQVRHQGADGCREGDWAEGTCGEDVRQRGEQPQGADPDEGVGAAHHKPSPRFPVRRRPLKVWKLDSARLPCPAHLP